MTAAGASMTRAFTLPIALIGIGSVKAAADFESSFAGVRKTVNATEQQFSALAQGMRDLSKEIPVNVNELNRIGEAAGQLGIRTENILSFTRVIADLGVTTNLTAEQAGSALARIANITGLAQTDFDRLGSTIVALGNTSATTEAEILDFGLRIAGAGEIAGLTEAQILSIGAAMSSVGIQAEAGGTAVQKVLLGMTQSVAAADSRLEVFAQTAGMTAAQFSEAFERDAGGAFAAFVEGLGKQGKAAFKTLEALNLQDQRLIRSFLSLAGAGDLVSRTMETGARAFEENTALAKEAEERYKTFASQMTKLVNQVRDAAITFGTALMPVIQDLTSKVLVPAIEKLSRFAEFFADLPFPVRRAALAIAGIGIVVGPVLIFLGNLTLFAGFAATAITGLGDASIVSAAKLKTLALWAGRLAIPLTAIAVLWKAMDQQGAAVARRVSELAAEMSSGAMTAEDLREKLDRLSKVPLKEQGTKMIVEVLALREALANLSAPADEATDAATALAAALDSLGKGGETGPPDRVIDEIAIAANKLSEALQRQLRVAKLEGLALGAVGEAAVILNTKIGLLAVAEQLGVDVTDAHVRSLQDEVRAIALVEQEIKDAAAAATREIELTRQMIVASEILTKRMDERAAAQASITKAASTALGTAAKTLNAQRDLAKAWEEGAEAVEALNSPMNQLVRSMEETLGVGHPLVILLRQMAQESDDLAAKIEEASEAADKAGVFFEDMGQSFADAVAQSIISAKSLGDSIRALFEGKLRSIIARFITDFISGFQKAKEAGVGAAKAIASAFKGLSTGGKIGLIIAAVTIAVSLFRKLGSEMRKAADVAAELGLTISEKLTKKIDLLNSSIGNVDAAFRQLFADVIREVGATSAEELGRLIQIASATLRDLLDGLIDSRRATTALGDSWEAILEIFESAGGTIRELNTIVAGMVSMLMLVTSGQITAADAAAALGQNFAALVAVARTLGDEGVDAIRRLVDAATAAGVEIEGIADVIRSLVDEALEILARRNAFLIDQASELIRGVELILASTGRASRREIEFTATAVLAAFNAMIAAGAPILDILDKLGAAFDAILERGRELGIELPDAFLRLGEILDVIGSKRITRLLNLLDGVTAATSALGNMGLLTASQFDFFGDSIRRAFRRLMAQGLTAEEALAILAPQLQQLNDLSQQYGFELDRNTQSLLDQARAQGLVVDKGLTMEDILIRGFDRLLMALNALIEAMGGVPIAFEEWGRAADGARHSVDRLIDSIGNVDIGDIQRPPPRPGRGFRHGSGGLRNFSSVGTPVLLHGREEVLTARQGSGVAAMVTSALAGGDGQGMLALAGSIEDLSRSLMRQQASVEIQRRDEGIKDAA